MSPADLTSYKQRLLALQQMLQGNVNHLTGEALRLDGDAAAGDLSAVPTHLADRGTESYEQELTLSLVQNEEERLQEIATALERIEQGTFGRCEECHKPIAKARLVALPYTRHCVACAQKLQQGY